MVENIFKTILALWTTLPLFYSVYFLLKFIKSSFSDWCKKRNTGFFIAKVAVAILILSITLFLLFFAFFVFVFPCVKLPLFFKVLGFVLFATYYYMFVGIAMGLSSLGHGGISPSYVFKELESMFSKKK